MTYAHTDRRCEVIGNPGWANMVPMPTRTRGPYDLDDSMEECLFQKASMDTDAWTLENQRRTSSEEPLNERDREDRSGQSSAIARSLDNR